MRLASRRYIRTSHLMDEDKTDCPTSLIRVYNGTHKVLRGHGATSMYRGIDARPKDCRFRVSLRLTA